MPICESLEFLSQMENKVWVGSMPPFDCDCVDIIDSNNFRVSSNLHGKYNCVWLFEELLSNVSSWKYYLDESIRLLDSDGYIVVRTQENSNTNIIELKKYIFRNKLIDNPELIYESEIKCPGHQALVKHERELTLVFKVSRKYSDIYLDNNWTFAIITQGKKENNVVEFCSNIRRFETSRSEILILGPKSEAYSKFDVIYLDTEYSEHYAEISKKKNSIIKAASNQNIFIAHDRYKINNDFFSGFEQYGYDFDFLTIRQNYESGDVFPGYLCLEKRLAWSQIYYFDDERYAGDSTFINGGLFILKKNIAMDLMFNPMIFWDQGEDVEYSATMLENGICPRINNFSSATTLGISTSHTETFMPLRHKKESLDNSMSKIKIHNNNFLIQLLKRYLPIRVKIILRRLLK